MTIVVGASADQTIVTGANLDSGLFIEANQDLAGYFDAKIDATNLLAQISCRNQSWAEMIFLFRRKSVTS